MLKIFQKFFILILLLSIPIYSQSFGFGCFGFVGGYGGYSYQTFEPGNLAEAVQRFNISKGSDLISEFGRATGYRIGINIIRANFDNFFITGKGYYQFLSEDKEYTFNENNNTINAELDLDLKNWGFGIDIGIPVTSALSWKIFDAAVHFNSARIKNRPDLSDNATEIKYSNDAPGIGYSLGTGFIISIAENFLSLEGSFSYTLLKIEKMIDQDNNVFFLDSDKNAFTETDFIKSGGFSAVVQLNVGFPL